MKHVVFIIAAACWIVLQGCTRSPKVASDTLVVALSASPATLDPRFATDAVGVRVAGLLFSSLVHRGSDLTIHGDAAESWKLEGDVYTFQLRPGLKFSDGHPLTTADLDYTFQEYSKPDNPYRSALEQVAKIETQYDDKARFVRLTLKQFNATLLSDLTSIQFLPKHLAGDVDSFAKTLVGTGPYKFVSQSTNEIRLEARTDHAYLKPKLPKLVFKVVRDDYTRFLKLYKGEIDIVQSDIPAARIATLEKKGDFNIFKFPGLSMTYLLINHRDPDLAKLPLRKAISQALNRDEIIKYKLEGLGQPATALITPVNPYFNSELKKPVFDPEAARTAIRKLGLNGKEFVLKTSNVQSAMENGKVIANQLQSVGLQIKMQSFEWGTFYGDVKKGNFQLATLKWVGNVDPDIYRLAMHSHETPENSGRNRGRYVNPRLDSLLEAGLKIRNEQERIHHYLEVQKIVYDDLAIVPLWYEMDTAIAHKRVKSYTPPQDGSFLSLIDVTKE
jgi:peptide/nickel transport system substrate-binding protein